MISSFLQDLRYSLRSLRRSPSFTLAAIAALAIGIGANTAAFSVVRSVLWKALPYRDAGRLVRVGHLRTGSIHAGDSFSPQDLEDLERSRTGLSAVAAWSFVPGLTGMNLTGSGDPARLETAFVSSAFFETFGARPLLGRPLAPEENVPGRDRVAVLSRRAWVDRFGGDPRIVGKMIRLDGRPFLVAGVMPSDFAFPSEKVDLWTPISLQTDEDVPHRREIRWLAAAGRLAPGVSIDQARASIDALLRRLEKDYPDSNAGFGRALVEPLADSVVGDLRRPLLLLLGAIGLVLLILCANLAGMLLARGAAKSREIAIRTALGATRARVVWHLLAESALLSGVGGIGGIFVGFWCVSLLPLVGGALPRAGEIRLDGSALAFAILISAGTGVFFGLVPALRTASPDVAGALEAGGRGGSSDRGRRRWLRGLVVGECLLAGVLLTGAGLLGKSFLRLIRVDAGIRPESVLSLSIAIPEDLSTLKLKAAYRDAILDRLGALPGVRAAGASKTMPMSGGGEPYGFRIEGRPEAESKARAGDGAFIVTPGYFAALGIPLVAGRDFSRADMDQSRLVAVVSRSVASASWPGQNPIGKRLALGPDTRLEVIGVAGEVRHAGLARPSEGAIYVPASLFPRSTMKIFLRFTGAPAPLVSAARQAIWSVNRNQPISEIATLPDVLSRSVARPRFFVALLVGFGAAALALAALGLYGTLSYGIRQRTREIGIRLALGAEGRDILLLVLREGAVLVLLGVALAAPVSIAAARLLGGLLYEVRPNDPVVMSAVPVFLVSVAVSASFFPARKASRTDPIVALRQD
ncbi:MAG: ABC transporter permease [Acidobacteriota bacterium]